MISVCPAPVVAQAILGTARAGQEQVREVRPGNYGQRRRYAG